MVFLVQNTVTKFTNFNSFIYYFLCQFKVVRLSRFSMSILGKLTQVQVSTARTLGKFL